MLAIQNAQNGKFIRNENFSNGIKLECIPAYYYLLLILKGRDIYLDSF